MSETKENSSSSKPISDLLNIVVLQGTKTTINFNPNDPICARMLENKLFLEKNKLYQRRKKLHI
jgi:hypothetical protein